MDRYSVNTTVWAGEVNKLEDIGSVGFSLHYLAELWNASLLDEDSLSGQDVYNLAEAKLR